MNQSLLKSFAPAARVQFREAMEQRAKLLGLSAGGECVPAQAVGSNVIVAGYSMPASWEDQRQKLKDRIKKDGWDKVIDEAAYTWFNRLSALRYMEVHSFMTQRVRVLTSATGEFAPEILAKAASLDFTSFRKAEIIELKMDGTKDEELYRRLLLAVCEGMHKEIPLLFPSVGEAFEILLPDNLLRQGSLLAWFLNGLPDEEWQEIEVLGWLYQYYISELKSEYMARKTAYKKEEIPAVTQLFTPKWIVQYLVHNSLGRSWLLHHPESGLKAKMPYYIEPAPQEPEVDAELKRLFSGDLNPEDIKLLDPAMGSGHILVTAYEVLREIYLERGYQRQQCARLILEKNLYGLDIDLRASEIACFALIMKAREDDPTILTSGKGLRLNLLSFKDCTPEERADLIQSLNPAKEQKESLQAVLSLFEQGTLFGSLIQIPEGLVDKLAGLAQWLEKVATSGDLLASKAAESAVVFVRLAAVLGQKYDQVVSNPPYMGNSGFDENLKIKIDKEWKTAKADIYACFILRMFESIKINSFLAMVTMDSWMFLPAYEKFREDFINRRSSICLLHMPYLGKGGTSMGISFGTDAAIFMKNKVDRYQTKFHCLRYFETDSTGVPISFPPINQKTASIDIDKLKVISGQPVSYWTSKAILSIFSKNNKLSDFGVATPGLQTSDNERFLKQWFEVNYQDSCFTATSSEMAKDSQKKWFPQKKGGSFRKWYGNGDYVVNWGNNGFEIKAFVNARYPYLNGNIDYVVKDRGYYFREGVSWTHSTSSFFSARLLEKGCIFNVEAPSFFSEITDIILPFLNSSVASVFLKMISDSNHYLAGTIADLPFDDGVFKSVNNRCRILSSELSELSKSDWDAYETSWDFQTLPWLPKVLPTYLKGSSLPTGDQHSLANCWDTWRAMGQYWTAEMLRLEEENNRLFIDAYGLQDELTPEVPIEQITLTVNPWYRYGRKAARGEGRGASEEGDFDGSELQRADSLAKGNADGSGDIQSDSNISQGRVVRVNESIKTGGSIGSVEHSRGEFSQHQGGIQTISGNSTGITGRDRDSITTVPAVGLSESNDLGSDPAYSNRSQQNDQCPPQKDGITSPLAPRPSSLTTPYLESLMRKDGARELVSYAIGCIMGRYSLEVPGLVLADSGCTLNDYYRIIKEKKDNSSFSPLAPSSLTPNPSPLLPDDDGILCITDMRWFDEDGADRVETFVRTVWGEERHDENMTWLANGLGVKGNESPDETLRRYLAGDFYKDHLQTYKKRPIYWKFSSGKEKAFEALVYLHRYNKGTLSRMRMQFVVPLSGKIRGQMGIADQKIEGASSTAEISQLKKQRMKLQAKLAELTAFDNELNHYAQMQIELDLDDGVRVNYGKFGGLLANVKEVCGKKEEE